MSAGRSRSAGQFFENKLMAFPYVETVQPFLARNRLKSRALVETLVEMVASLPPSWAISVSASVISVACSYAH